jgi:hypothetical protein
VAHRQGLVIPSPARGSIRFCQIAVLPCSVSLYNLHLSSSSLFR